jgi:hypothetical protein
MIIHRLFVTLHQEIKANRIMEKFKVYKGTSAAAYSGGCLLIAARNLDEANQFLTEEPSAFSQFGDEPRRYYGWHEIDPLEEVKGLTYEGDEPKVILYEIYAE